MQQKYIPVVKLCFYYVHLEPQANAQVTILFMCVIVHCMTNHACMEVVSLECMAQEFMHILLLKRILRVIVQIVIQMQYFDCCVS